MSMSQINLIFKNYPSLLKIAKKLDNENLKIFTDEFNKSEEKSNVISSILNKDGLFLQYIEEQTPELCNIAVIQNEQALKYVKNQTPELCHIAICQNVDAAEFIVNDDHLKYCLEIMTKITYIDMLSNFLNNIPDDNKECPICQEILVEGNAVLTINCNHMFHKTCLISWMQQSKNTCPMCKCKLSSD